MWINIEVPIKTDDEVYVLVLLKQEYCTGFAGMPIPYNSRIKKGAYSPTKQCFSYDNIFNANNLISHYCFFPKDPLSE